MGDVDKRQLDPICGKRLDASEGRPTTEYKKRRYFFCSERCRTVFEQKAARFRMNDLARAGALMTPGRVRWGIA
jgi:YHS domain-containing protein